MVVVTIHKAKTELSKLIARVEAGEEISIARNKNIVAKIVPIEKVKKNLGVGVMKHLSPIADSVFFESVSDEDIEAWDGKHGVDP